MGLAPSVFAAFAAVFALSGPAFAECPAPGDLARGIALRDDTGGVTTFRRGARPGEVTETTLFDDNTGFFIRASGGLLVQESYELENGQPVDSTTVETTLDAPETAFPVAEGRRRELRGTERAADGAQTPLTVVIETSLRRTVLYGDCAAEAIPVRVTYAYEGSLHKSDVIVRLVRTLREHSRFHSGF